MFRIASSENQARILGEYALNFLKNAAPSAEVLDRVKMFHTDSVLCGISALAQGTNAPNLLRNEALRY